MKKLWFMIMAIALAVPGPVQSAKERSENCIKIGGCVLIILSPVFLVTGIADLFRCCYYCGWPPLPKIANDDLEGQQKAQSHQEFLKSHPEDDRFCDKVDERTLTGKLMNWYIGIIHCCDAEENTKQNTKQPLTDEIIEKVYQEELAKNRLKRQAAEDAQHKIQKKAATNISQNDQ